MQEYLMMRLVYQYRALFYDLACIVVCWLNHLSFKVKQVFHLINRSLDRVRRDSYFQF